MATDSIPAICKMSQRLQQSDCGSIDNTERTDVENHCSLIGAYDVCSMFRDVIPIVHGPLSCINSYYSTKIVTRLKGKVKPFPFSTCMNENDVIFGATEKLGEMIKEIDRLYHPRLIVILTTCVADMIAEDVNSVIREIKEEVNATLLLMNTAGIACEGFRTGADYAFNLLMDHVKEKNLPLIKTPNSINLFLSRMNGKISEEEELSEITKILAVNGINVNVIIKNGLFYDELLQIPRAEVNATLCLTYGKEVMNHLQDLFGQPFSNVSYPIGISATKKWVGNITQILKLPDKFSDSPEVREAEKKIEEVKAFLAGKMKIKRMFIWHPGEKALALTKLAYDLELEPIIVGFAGCLYTINRETITGMLDDGYDPPVITQGYPDILLDYEQKYKYDERPVLFMPKKYHKANSPTVDIDLRRDCTIGLSGIENIVKKLHDCYEETSQSNDFLFDKYVYKPHKPVNSDFTTNNKEKR